MSNDTNNIKLPNGETVSIPAWASELTLKVLVEQLKLSNQYEDALIKEVSGLTVDTDGMENVLQDLFKRLHKRQEDIKKEEIKSRKEYAKEISKATSDLVGRFSNTEAPLTSMVNNVRDLGGAIGRSASNWLRDTETFSQTTKDFLGAAGGALDLLGDGAMAYLGFQAARLEEFAKAQSSMINAGVIFFEGADAYDQLKASATRAGITYTHLAGIAGQYGQALTVLGTGVSSGTAEFVRITEELNNSSDALGDFGLSNDQLAQGFAEYISVARITGAVNRNTVDASTTLQTGYRQLMMETTALAALTGDSRDQILQRRYAALSEPITAAGLTRLREAGNIASADMAEGIISQFQDNATMLPTGLSDLMSTAIGRGLMNSADDISSFDIDPILDSLDPAMAQALRTTGVTSEIEQAIRTGQVNADNADTFITELFANLQTNAAILRASGNTEDPFFQAMRELEASSFRLQEFRTNMLNMTDEELAEYRAQTEAAMGESGQANAALNDITIAFLTAQDALTLPLDSSAAAAEVLADLLRRGATTINDLINNFGQERDDAPPDLDSEAFQQIIDSQPGNETITPDARAELMTGQPIPFDADLLEDYGVTTSDMPVRRHPLLNMEVYELPHMMQDQGRYMFREGESMPAPQQRRYGGPVSAGTGYIVGEAGPEYIEPGQSGNVTKYEELTAMLRERLGIVNEALDNFAQVSQLPSAMPRLVLDGLAVNLDRIESISTDTLGQLTGLVQQITSVNSLFGGKPGSLTTNIGEFSPNLVDNTVTQELDVQATVLPSETKSEEPTQAIDEGTINLIYDNMMDIVSLRSDLESQKIDDGTISLIYDNMMDIVSLRSDLEAQAIDSGTVDLIYNNMFDIASLQADQTQQSRDIPQEFIDLIYGNVFDIADLQTRLSTFGESSTNINENQPTPVSDVTMSEQPTAIAAPEFTVNLPPELPDTSSETAELRRMLREKLEQLNATKSNYAEALASLETQIKIYSRHNDEKRTTG